MKDVLKNIAKYFLYLILWLVLLALGCVLIIFIFGIITTGFNYARHIFQDEDNCYVVEHVSVCEDRYFTIIHKTDCDLYSNSRWYDVRDFIKDKSYIYCKQCIGKLDVAVFNTHHRKNYNKYEHDLDAPLWLWDDYEIDSPYRLQYVRDSNKDECVRPNKEERKRFSELSKRE